MHQRSMRTFGKTILGTLSVLLIVLRPEVKAATLLSPEPAYNAWVVRLQYAVQPKQRPQMIGRQMLEFASNWTGTTCMTSHAWAPWLSAGQARAN